MSRRERVLAFLAEQPGRSFSGSVGDLADDMEDPAPKSLSATMSVLYEQGVVCREPNHPGATVTRMWLCEPPTGEDPAAVAAVAAVAADLAEHRSMTREQAAAALTSAARVEPTPPEQRCPAECSEMHTFADGCRQKQPGADDDGEQVTDEGRDTAVAYDVTHRTIELHVMLAGGPPYDLTPTEARALAADLLYAVTIAEDHG